MFKLFGNIPLPMPIMRPLTRLGSGKRTVLKLHREIDRASNRKYDIQKIGAKTLSRIEKATRLGRIHDALERGMY